MESFSDVYGYFIGFFILYGLVLFFDTIFRSCMFYPYLSMMNRLGIRIKPCLIVWNFTIFNKAFFTIGNFMPNLLKLWFTLGYYCTFISIFVSTGLLILPLIRHFTFKMQTGDHTEPIVSIIPGITTPFSHVMYILPALVVSVLFHEFGHAIAATQEKVPVENCGIALALIVPVAFVNLSKAKLSLCNHMQQLRVFCAGVWHNLILLLFSALFVHFLPTVLHPGIIIGTGVTVIDVKQTSSLAHVGGFSKHDVVISMNGCEVKDYISWYNCLAQVETSHQIGFCSSENYIQTHGDMSNCCTNTSQHLCFKYIDNIDSKSVCLMARQFIDQAKFCRNNSDCPEMCLIPFLTFHEERLIKFERQNKKPVLYIGTINELIYSIKVSSWVSHISFPSIELLIFIENFLKYVAGISAGLVVMNVIPCFYLDGGYIIENIIELYFKKMYNRAVRNVIVYRLKFAGFILLGISVMMGIKTVIVIL